MKFWHALTFMDPAEAIELAVVSDEHGYDGLCVADHLFSARELKSKYPYSETGEPRFEPDAPWPDPWVLIGAMAARTERIRFTTNVFIAPLRDIFTVAKAVGTAAIISNNRVALGMGMGWMREEFEQTGQDFDTRGKRANEMIPLLKELWTGDWVEHHGEHYDFDALRVLPAPSEPIPIYIGGHSPAALRRATELADGWIGVDYKLDEAEELVRKIGAKLKQVGRDGQPFEIILALWAQIDSNLCNRFADLGVTGLMCAPWMFTKDNSIQGRVDAVKRYADDVIAKVQ